MKGLFGKAKKWPKKKKPQSSSLPKRVTQLEEDVAELKEEIKQRVKTLDAPE